VSVVSIGGLDFFSGSKKGASKMNEWKEVLRPIGAQKDSRRKVAGTLVPWANVENVMKLGFVLE
jgi:hypothetical protein